MAVGVVVNPAAGGGRLLAAWPELARMLEARLGPLEVLRTSAPGEGRALAGQLVRRGAQLVIAAGGDGTANEVVDGLLGAGGGPELGVISVGTGRDFIRTLGNNADLAAAVDAIGSGRARAIDAGRVSYTADNGAREARHFLNVASLGVSGPTVRAVNASKQGRRVHGKVAFYYHTVMELLKYRPQQVRVRFEDGETIEVSTALVAIANGKFFGSGMMIAPDAAIDDGQFDVLVYRAEGKLRMILDFNTIYRGAHVALPRVTSRRCRWVEIEPVGDVARNAAIIEVDGESPGRIPARFEVMPGALRLRG
ncbi:MAG: diacylglycerol kinase family lipid kinase [Hyphomicrobiales bacterium]|nr:MAG: diacylglycerol kinase family lipid kinase [Hyphomicrobiales bacterium]